MPEMETISAKIAEYLLEIKATRLQPHEPFTWTSGWKSPIYNDNRVSLSYPEVRNYVKEQMAAAIQEHFSTAEVLIGVATAGIAPGALAADELQLPFAYVRSEAKKHGMGNQVEGHVQPGQKVVVIEDLVSTGKSSLAAVQALKDYGCEVLGLVSIFNYGFEVARNSFAAIHCPVVSLCYYDDLIRTAIARNYVQASDLELLSEWRKNPESWGK